MAAESRPPSSRSRRSMLVGATGALGVAGTVGVLTGRERLRVLAAASLAGVLEEYVGPAFEAETDIRVDGEYLGTTAILRLVERGDRRPDVVIGADTAAQRERLEGDHADWTLEVATNELVLAYAPETDLGEALTSGGDWQAHLTNAAPGTIGMSDPDHHPLGVRSLLMLDLAERYYDRSGFREAVLDRTTTDGREGQLLGGLEAGNRACVFCYRNMARNWEVPFLDLASAINFGSPAYEQEYQTVRYERTDGETIRGSLTSYGATVLRQAGHADAGERFVRFLTDEQSLLEVAGLTVPASFPRATGPVPEGIDA